MLMAEIKRKRRGPGEGILGCQRAVGWYPMRQFGLWQAPSVSPLLQAGTGGVRKIRLLSDDTQPSELFSTATVGDGQDKKSMGGSVLFPCQCPLRNRFVLLFGKMSYVFLAYGRAESGRTRQCGHVTHYIV
jgi:hypothetical protein